MKGAADTVGGSIKNNNKFSIFKNRDKVSAIAEEGRTTESFPNLDEHGNGRSSYVTPEGVRTALKTSLNK